MLEVNQLTKSFGNRIAVDHLDFKIAFGEVLCLLGANGAGKTTTLNMLLGFTTNQWQRHFRRSGPLSAVILLSTKNHVCAGKCEFISTF